MIKGNVYVRMSPHEYVVTPKYKSDELDKVKLVQEARTIFDLEMWLNNEIAIQAFDKFKVGLRFHIPED